MAEPQPSSPAGPETARQQSQRRQVAALLGLGLLLALLLGGGIAWQHGAFQPMAQVYFLADDVTAVTPGTTVRLSGFRIGKVQALQLQPDLKVRVTLTIEAEAFAHLRSDARAELVREQLKPAAIDLRPGSADALLSAADPRIGFRRRGTLTEIAEDLRGRLAPILDDLHQLSSTVRERRGDIDEVLRNASTLSRELAGTAQQMHALSGELRQRAAALGTQSERALGEVNQSLVRVGGLIGQADRSFESINGRLPALLGKTDDLLGHLDAVLRDTRTVTGAAAEGLPPLMRSAPALVDDSREMVQGLRQSWPMRNLLPPPPPAQLPIDSHDSRTLREPTRP